MVRKLGYTVGIGVVVALALVAVGGSLAATGPQGTAQPAPSNGEASADVAAGAQSVSFGSVQAEARGDVAEITLDLQDTDTATLQIGTEEEGYVAETTVRDGNGDGTVVILFNTYTAGTHENGYTVVSTAGANDSVEGTSEGASLTEFVSDPRNATLDAGSYQLSVWPGTEMSGGATDFSTLSVRSNALESMDQWFAPRGRSLSTLSAVRDAKANGTLQERRDVPRDSVLVYEIRATGIEGIFRNELTQGASSSTEAFVNLVGSDDRPIDLVIAGTGAELPVERARVRFVPDYDTDRYYVVYDTAGLTSVGEEYETTFSVSPVNATGPTLGGSGAGSMAVDWRVAEPLSTPTPTATPTPTPSPTATLSPTPTASPTAAGTAGSPPTGSTTDSDIETADPDTEMEQTTSTTTAASTERAQTDDTPAGTDASGPGYTPVSALVAILLIALWAARRR